eukprot:1850492-Lingulodinium_polyedra.AAC.1
MPARAPSATTSARPIKPKPQRNICNLSARPSKSSKPGKQRRMGIMPGGATNCTSRSTLPGSSLACRSVRPR